MSDPFVCDLIALLPRLRRFAIALARSRHEADDLLQTACEKALANRDHFEPGTRFDAWMFRIVRNAWTDRLRQTRKEGTRVDIEDAGALVGDDGERTSAERLRLAETAKAIGALPHDLREVLILVTVEGFTYREAAEVLSIPLGTVMSRLARARQRLEAMLE